MNRTSPKKRPLAALKLYKPVALALLALLMSVTANATLLWESDTNRGTSIFEGLEKAPGTIVLTNDPLFQQGIVYQYNTWDDTNYGKERCESRGTVATSGDFRMSYDNEYYYGWKEMWQPMPINGSWVALHQMHGYGVTGQGAPLVLRCVNGDGNLYMQNGANGVDTNFWHVSFKTNIWQSFVVHVYLDTNPAVGYVEIWYNGQMQTFNNGQTRWYGPTWDNVDGKWQDSYNLLKWGVYRSGTLNGHGPASTYWTDAKIGTTYDDVNPLNGGSFAMTTTPASQSVPPGGTANYTITTTPVDGFSTNISLSVSGLPVDASASFSPATITNSGPSTLTVNASALTPIGNYPLTILGTSVVATNTNTVMLTVTTFTLSAPASTTLQAGNSTNLTVTVTTNGFFTGSVTFGVAGLPSGATSSFAPPTLLQSGPSTWTISTSTNTVQGTYPLTIYGTNGYFVTSTNTTLVVNGLQANPGVLVWTNAATDTNWSSAFNWFNITGGGYGPPGISNSVVFTNYSVATASALSPTGSGNVVAANINSSVNASFAVIAITNFANAINTSPNYQNIGIAPGATLRTGAMQIGGFGLYDFGVNNVVNTTISGTGAALMVTNGAVIVSQGSGSSGGAHNATLDLSGLDNFIYDGAQLKIGVETMTHAGGIVYLAKTNTLTLLTAGYINTDGSGSPYSGNPALYIGHNKEGAGQGAQLYLGVANTIGVDYVTVGRGDNLDGFRFNPAFYADNPSVTITGTNGSSPVGVYVVADGSPGQAVSSFSTNDFTGGTVSALINYLCIGRGREGANDTTTSSGFLTFSNGTITANTLVLGFLYPSGSNSFANGIMNVNGGSTLAVITNIVLGSVPGAGTGRAQGTLNINGGTVDVPVITGGGGTSIINFNSGTLETQPGWATTLGAIQNVSTLNIGASGSSLPALLIAVSQISSTNTVTIASNGIVSGNIIITTPMLLVNGTISPGNQGAGAVTNSGAVTFGPGGNYDVNVDDALAGPVDGWSFLQTGAGINIQATPANPITIGIQTLDNPAANFNPANNYDWVIATAGNGITNFAPDDFVINTASFQNSLGSGAFYVHTNGNSLVLSFTNNLPPALAMNITASGTNIILSGSSGSAGMPYYILSTTNLVLPFTNWTVIVTNTLDASGNFIFTNPQNPATPQEFFLLKSQ